jgi:hypothetical protein
MAWIRTPFFFIFDFSLRFAAVDHSKKGVKQEQKQQQKQKVIVSWDLIFFT